MAGLAAWLATSKIGRALAAGLGLAAAIAAAALAVFSAGKRSERAHQDRQSLDNMRSRARTDVEIDSLGHADLDERARRWMRDDDGR